MGVGSVGVAVEWLAVVRGGGEERGMPGTSSTSSRTPNHHVRHCFRRYTLHSSWHGTHTISHAIHTTCYTSHTSTYVRRHISRNIRHVSSLSAMPGTPVCIPRAHAKAYSNGIFAVILTPRLGSSKALPLHIARSFRGGTPSQHIARSFHGAISPLHIARSHS